MYSNTAFIPQSSPLPLTPGKDAWAIMTQGDTFSAGIYNYANAARDPQCAEEARRIFGDNLIPPDKKDLAALMVGDAVLTRSGMSANPEAYFKQRGWTVPTGYGDYTNLTRLAGQRILEEAGKQYDDHQKALEVARTQLTNLPEDLASSIYKSGALGAEAAFAASALTPESLERISKFYDKDKAVESHQRALTAWTSFSGFMHDVDGLQTMNRETLRDIAAILQDKDGKPDPLATAVLSLLVERRATAMQQENPEAWDIFADSLQNWAARWKDQDAKDKASKWNTMVENWAAAGIDQSTINHFADRRYNNQAVEQLYGTLQNAMNTAMSPSEKADWKARTIASAARMVGESIVPTLASLGITYASRGAGFGAAASTLGAYATNVAINSNSLINAAIADAYYTGKVNPEIHGRIQGSAQAATEGVFDAGTSLPIVGKLVGKTSNKIAATAAGSRFLTNVYGRTTLNYFTSGAIQGFGELAEEELGGYLESSINTLARNHGIQLSPVQYKFGETLGSMKSHEIAAIFCYSYTMGLLGVPANYRIARETAANTDALLAAGHSPAAVRDIQEHLFNTADKIAEVNADSSLTAEQKKKQVDKLNKDFFTYQQRKAQSDIWDADPEEVRQRLQKENKKTLEKAELALAIQADIDKRIAQKFGIIDTTAQPGDKFAVTLMEKGEPQEDGKEAPAKLVTQEWTRNQLTNFFQIQKADLLMDATRAFQGVVQAHAAAQTITNIDDLKIEFQNLRDTPLEAYAELQKHHGITENFIAALSRYSNIDIQKAVDSGLTIAEARALPSPILKGVTLGEAANLKTDALIRKEQEQATDSGLVAPDARNIEYGAFNITRADGSVLIAYANSRADTNDILEELLEAYIKHQLNSNPDITEAHLAAFLTEVDKHLPGKSILPKNKKPGEYTRSDLVEAYSRLALASYIYQEAHLPLSPGGHQLLQNIGKILDTAHVFKTIGDAWHTYANSPEGKAHLANGGKQLADILRESGFKVGSLVAQAKATAQQQIETIEAANWQPDIEAELDALLEGAEAEQQLAEINEQQAKEPITIPAEESITGQEITVEPTSEQETLVSPDDTPESHLRNLITQGKATIRDFADFFKDHDITEAQATELGIRPLGQNGEPTYTYRMGLRLGIGMRFGTYTSEEQIQNFIIVALVDERVREIAGEDTTSYKLERKAEAVRKNARIFRDTASASRAKYNQAKAAGGSLPMPEAPQWPAPKKKADNSQDNIVNILAPMTSKDKYRDFLTVIHKETKDGITSYVATDGTRLSMLSRKASAKEDSHIVINPKTKAEGNAENYATLHWRQVIPTKADIETTIDLAPMLALKNFRKKGGTKAGFRLTSAGTTHRSVIIKAEDHTVFVDAFRFREAVEQLANLSKTLGFPSTVKLSLLKEDGPITLSASHNGWEWKALIMPLSKANESAGDIILSEKPTILASVEKHSEDYIEKLRQEAEYDEAKAQEFEDEATNLEEQARMLASIEAQLPENDRLARWVASYFERPRMSAIFDVIKTIRSGDVQKFMPWLTNPENNLIRKLYEKISGTKLPKNTDDYKAAVDKWVSTLHSAEDPTATFSIKPAAADTLDRFTVDPLGERIIHHIRTESRRYARLLGDKTPYEQAVNAAQSAASIIGAVDKFLHTPGKPVPARYRRQLQKLRSIAEKYAQIIASGTPRSFKKISPQEKQELEAAIAELEAQELETATTESDQLLTDSDRLTKREAAARAREHHRAIVRSAAKGRVYQTLSSMLEITADALDSYLKHQLLQKLDRLTATVKIKRSPSKRLQGKMTAPAYRELERAISNMALSDRAYQDEIENVITAHETLARAINESRDNLTSGNALLIQLAQEITASGQQVTPQTLTAALANHEAALKIYGNVSSKNYEQTRLMANALFYLIRNGRNQWKDRHEAREARIQQYLRYFLAHTTPESETANAKRNKNESLKWKDALSLDITMNAAQTIMALSSYEALRPLMQDLLANYSTASVARQKHLEEIRKQELYAFGRIIGATPSTDAGYTDTELKELSDKLDSFYAENNKTVETTITPTRLVRNADGELEPSTSAPLKLTKWEALNLILTYRQEHYQPNAAEHGFTPEVIDQLTNFIGQKMMDFGNAMQKILVNDGTIAVYEEREGIPMRPNPLYWPGHININTINTTRDEPLVNPYHPAASHDFLHARVRNRQEVANRNAFGVFRKAIADRANYIYADPVTETITSLLSRDQFANRLETLIGGNLKRQLQTVIREIKGAAWQETSLQDATSGIISAAFGAKSLAVLSGNPSSLIRQLSAAANAGLMPGISPQQYLAYAIKAKQNQSHISFTDILKLDAFTTRKRDNAYVNEMIAMGADATFSTLMNWAKTGINAMDKLDLYANAFSATVIYNIKYDQLKAQGNLTEEQIRKRCEQEVAIYTKLLAQPLNRVDKSALYWMIGNHAIGRSILFMGSEAINKVGMLRANYIMYRNQGNNPAVAAGKILGKMGITVGLAAAVNEAILALLTGRTPDDDDSQLAFYLALWLNASYGQYLSTIPLLGGVTDIAFSPYGGYFGGETVLPGSQLFTRDIGKLHTMLTDDKEYSGQQWNKEINRFMRNFTTILGYAGGANSKWQIYSSFAAFCQSLTAALNAQGFIINAAANLTGTEDEKPRRSKSKIEKWLTPDTPEKKPRRRTTRATRARRTRSREKEDE